MVMMNEIVEYLRELDFVIDEKTGVLPKLNEVSKRFRELAKLRHSDKGGDDAAFIKLYYAYNQIKKFYKNMKDEDIQKYGSESEEEEELIKRLFEEFNFSRKNKYSFTIFIENDLSGIWNEVLEKSYGKPEDKGVNGLHWSHKGYQYQELEKSDIYMRKYHKPKSDNTSKIVIQGNFELAVAFVAKELPKLYKKVHDKKKKPIEDETKSCEKCPFTSSVLVDFNKHLNTEHKEETDINITTTVNIKCVKCDIEVADDSEMKKHLKKPHKKCDHCQFQTTKLTELRPHIETEHGGTVNCETCDFSGNDIKSLKKHMEEDHKCSKCGKSRGKKIIIDCKNCKMPTHLECLKMDIGKERAEKYKSNQNEYQCKACLEKFIGIGDTNPVLANETYSCEYCSLTINTEKEFSEHVATHSQTANIKCDICEQVFQTSQKLEEHITTHAGTSSFVCPICNYKARSVEEVQIHMKDHDNNTNIMKGLEKSCRKLEEQIIVERKCNEKNIAITKELEEKIKTLSTEVEQSKEMVKNEIRKNEEKQEKIENLEETIRTHDDNGIQNNEDTKQALERAKDVIIEYKSEIARLTKEKDIEVGKVMVEKIRVEEDLRIATLEKKRLADTERILLNTFDTLKKYYETKEKETQENQETESEERYKCNKCKFETTTRMLLNNHITDVPETRNFKCTKCNFEDTTEDDLKRHIFNTHIDDGDIKCRKCNYEAYNREDLSKHIADVHDIDIRQNRHESANLFTKNRATFREKQMTDVCTYWKRGYCKFGNRCFKKHEDTTPYCHFQERCNRINTCKFVHEHFVHDFLDNKNNTKYHR